jgi:endo-1,4-beta-xylanase
MNNCDELNFRRAWMSAPALVGSLFAALCLLAASGASAQTNNSMPALKDAFKNDFLIGAAINGAQIYGEDSRGVQVIKTQFNSITPENILKWEWVHPQLNQYDFEGSDRYVEFGEKNHMFIIGHTLVWHSQTPRWVFQDDNGKPVDRDTLLNRMSNHIHTVVGRYKGRVKGWDVVNEAVAEDGSLRQSPWLKIIGEDFIEKAFQFAHEADPQAELYYNEFGLENETKRNGAIALLEKLQSHGVKISGVGLQGHYRLNEPDAAAVDETITAISNLGLKIMITELDVNVLPSPMRSISADVSLRFAARGQLNPYTNGLPDSVQQQLATRYAELFGVFLRHRTEIKRVTFWGVADGDSWLNDWPVRGRTAYPLLFDRNYAPKPAFRAVIEKAAEFRRVSTRDGSETLAKKNSGSVE